MIARAALLRHAAAVAASCLLIGPAAIALRQPAELRHDVPVTPYVTDTPSIAIELYGHGEITSAGYSRRLGRAVAFG